MSGRPARGAFLLLVVLVAGCGGSKRTAPPPTTTVSPPPLPSRFAVGVHYDCTTDTRAHRPKVFALLAAAHVDWVRINTSWSSLEPSKGRWSSTALRSVDDCVSLAKRAGLLADLVFLSTPGWAGPDTLAPPSDPAEYAHAIRFLAKRYRGRVRAWEIWNEENTKSFWTGTAADYAHLLEAAYPAIKSADPNALAVFGGTYGNDAGWLRAVYVAGAKGSFDVMATHPYPDGPAKAVAVHAVMASNGDGGKPIWFTEIGYAAPLRMSLGEQARKLTDVFDYTRTHLSYVKAVFWFQALSVAPGASPWEHDLELLNGDLTPRPAYAALRRVGSER